LTGMGITVKDALDLECLRNAKLIAGEVGLNCVVTSVDVMKRPDAIDWAKKGELLLTTSEAIPDDGEAQARLIPRLAQRGLAALVIRPSRGLDEIPRAMIDQAEEYGLPLIGLPADASPDDVVNPVLNKVLEDRELKLRRSRDMHRRFGRLVLAGAGLEEISKAFADLAGVPITVVDQEFRVLAHADGEHPSRGTGREEFAQALDRLWATQRPALIGLQGPTRYSVAVGDRRPMEVVIAPIVVSGETHGYLAAWETEARIEEDDLILVEHAVTVAGLEMMKQRAVRETERRLRNGFLDDLLAGNFESVEAVVRRAASFNWDFRKSYVLVLVDIDRFEDYYLSRPDADDAHIRRITEKLFRLVGEVVSSYTANSVVAEKSDSIIVLFHPRRELDEKAVREEAEQVTRAIVERVREQLHEISVSVGIGRFRRNVLELRHSFREAEEALRAGRAVWGRNRAFHFDALGVYRLLYRFPDIEELRRFYDETVGSLVRYDRQNGTELVRTLETFFEKNGNLHQSAKSLYVHYNTLRYRVQRISEVSGLDLDDAEARLNLQVGLKIRRILQKRD